MKNKDQISLLRSALMGARPFVIYTSEQKTASNLSLMAKCAIGNIDLALIKTDPVVNAPAEVIPPKTPIAAPPAKSITCWVEFQPKSRRKRARKD